MAIAVLVATAEDPSLHRDTAAALIPAMTAAGITRFVAISGAVAADKSHELELVTASDLTWTLVRPPRLTDGPATGRLEHDPNRSTASTRITRGDLAAFLADALEQDLYPRQAPCVASAR